MMVRRLVPAANCPRRRDRDINRAALFDATAVEWEVMACSSPSVDLAYRTHGKRADGG